ncbi:MAG: hypothetical protein LBS68_01920 [Puniceicoccales bacterium]|jgi:hypothetical protein|nr:hypothetical protein [Puniceicoccales bacterium]
MEVHWSGWHMSVVPGEESADFVQILAARMAPAPDRSIVVKIFATSLAVIGSVVTYPVVVAVGLLTLPFLWIGKIESFRKNIFAAITFGFLRTFFHGMFGKIEPVEKNKKEKSVAPREPEPDEVEVVQHQEEDQPSEKKATEPCLDIQEKLEAPVIWEESEKLVQVKDELRASLESIGGDIGGEIDKFLNVELAVGELCSIAEFLSKNETQIFVGGQNGKYSLAKFVNAVANDPSTFGRAFSWLQFASACEGLAGLKSCYAKRQTIIGFPAIKSDIMNGLNENQMVPLCGTLRKTLEAIIDVEIEILETSKTEENNWLTAPPSENTTAEQTLSNFLEALNEAHNIAICKIENFARLFFDKENPMVNEEQVRYAYVQIMCELGKDLSKVFDGNEYQYSIDCDKILNTAGVVPATGPEIASSVVTKSAFLAQAGGAVEQSKCLLAIKPKKVGKSLGKICLPHFFPGIFFGGAGLASVVFRVNFGGAGIRFIRPLFSKDAESQAFINATALGRSYVKSTQENPNVEGRTLACCAIGKQMAKLSGGTYASPTFDAEILTSPNGGEKYLSMTPAGTQTLKKYLHSEDGEHPSEVTIESSIWCQLFNFIVGQLDGHWQNLMVDADGIVRAIDPGLTFPSYDLGTNGEEMITNMAVALVENHAVYKKAGIPSTKKYLEENSALANIFPELPPMTEKMASVLMEISQPGSSAREELINTLKSNGMIGEEIQAENTRLDVIWKQLQNPGPVIVGKDETFRSLWDQNSSPLTDKTSLLRKHWVELYEAQPATDGPPPTT